MIGYEIERFSHRFFDVGQGKLSAPRAGEFQKLLNDSLTALGFLVDDFQRLILRA